MLLVVVVVVVVVVVMLLESMQTGREGIYIPIQGRTVTAALRIRPRPALRYLLVFRWWVLLVRHLVW